MHTKKLECFTVYVYKNEYALMPLLHNTLQTVPRNVVISPATSPTPQTLGY